MIKPRFIGDTGSDDDTVLSFLSVSKSLSNKDAANIIKEMIRDINIPRGTSKSYLLYLKLAALSKAVMVLEETDRAKRKEWLKVREIIGIWFIFTGVVFAGIMLFGMELKTIDKIITGIFLEIFLTLIIGSYLIAG